MFNYEIIAVDLSTGEVRLYTREQSLFQYNEDAVKVIKYKKRSWMAKRFNVPYNKVKIIITENGKEV